MPIDMIRVPARGPVAEAMVDRRTGQTWTVNVDPFEIAPTVVTVGQWNALRDTSTEPMQADFPKVDVSWRQAISFCNDMSLRDKFTPAYAITTVEPPTRETPPGLRTTSRPPTTGALRGTVRRTDTASPRMPNGRSHAGQVRLALAMATWTRSLGTRTTLKGPCIQLRGRRRTRGDCSTPWVGCGSGAGTSTTRRYTGRIDSSEGAAGATRTGAAGLEFVARPILRLPWTTWDSA